MKVRKRYGNEIVVMYAYIFWEHVFEFINGQGCEGGRVQWNIAKNMVNESKIKQPQIDFYMMHTCYGGLKKSSRA